MLGHPLQTLSLTPVKRPSNRLCLDLEEELELEDDPLEAAPSWHYQGQHLCKLPNISVFVCVSECACGDGSSLDKNSDV